MVSSCIVANAKYALNILLSPSQTTIGKKAPVHGSIRLRAVILLLEDSSHQSASYIIVNSCHV